MKKFLLLTLFFLSTQGYADDDENIVNSGYKSLDDSEDIDKGYIVKSPNESEQLAIKNKNMPEILCTYAPSQTEVFSRIIERENLATIGLGSSQK